VTLGPLASFRFPSPRLIEPDVRIFLAFRPLQAYFHTRNGHASGAATVGPGPSLWRNLAGSSKTFPSENCLWGGGDPRPERTLCGPPGESQASALAFRHKACAGASSIFSRIVQRPSSPNSAPNLFLHTVASTSHARGLSLEPGITRPSPQYYGPLRLPRLRPSPAGRSVAYPDGRGISPVAITPLFSACCCTSYPVWTQTGAPVPILPPSIKSFPDVGRVGPVQDFRFFFRGLSAYTSFTSLPGSLCALGRPFFVTSAFDPAKFAHRTSRFVSFPSPIDLARVVSSSTGSYDRFQEHTLPGSLPPTNRCKAHRSGRQSRL